MKIAVLGCGGMGRSVLGHARTSPHVQTLIGYDANPAAVERARQQVPGVEAAADLDALLADPQVRVVFVTASNDAHKPLALAALRAGKAVLCEKPIANTLADAEMMVDEAERLGAFFQIGFELRYSQLYLQVKNWIDQGLLGDIVTAQCTYICSEFHHKNSWRNDPATGGSMFAEKLCHYVDLPRWWIGSPATEVYAACAPNVVPYFKVHDNYFATCKYACGAVSQLNFVMYLAQTFDGDPLQDVVAQQRGDGHELRCLITGTRGGAATDVFNRSLKRWEFGDSPACMTSKLVEERTWAPEEDHHYFHDGRSQTLDVLRRVAEGLPPYTPARDALETMRLVDAADESAEAGRPVQLQPAPPMTV